MIHHKNKSHTILPSSSTLDLLFHIFFFKNKNTGLKTYLCTIFLLNKYHLLQYFVRIAVTVIHKKKKKCGLTVQIHFEATACNQSNLDLRKQKISFINPQAYRPNIYTGGLCKWVLTCWLVHTDEGGNAGRNDSVCHSHMQCILDGFHFRIWHWTNQYSTEVYYCTS